MNYKNIQNKGAENKSLKPLNGVKFCEVSKASADIMLERFRNGKQIDFPFTEE